jgi:basic amino acid/polyamine antiporter, APA family
VGRDGLRREVGLGAATAAVAGEVIAVGIFLTPAGMIKSIRSPFWLITVWAVMGTMALCGAFCYGHLASRYPFAGGGYVYLREIYGDAVAFAYGWMSFLVMDPGITAALALGLASYAGYFYPLTTAAEKGVAAGTILALAGANIVGIRAGARAVRLLTVAKFGALAIIALWGFGQRLGDWSNFLPFFAQRAGSAPLPAALAGGMVAAFFSFGGWWDVSKIGSEVRDPARTLPRAMTLGVAAATAAYLLITVVFLYLVPASRITSNETFAAQAGEALFGVAGGRIFAGVVILSVLGSLAGLVMTAPRVYYAMARDGLFPHSVAQTSARFGTPARAIALQAAVSSVLVVFGGFGQIVAYFVFIAVIFMGLTVAGVFRTRVSREPGSAVPGYPATPVVFLLLVSALLLLLATANPKQSLLGVTVTALGIPAYLVRQRRLHAAPPEA